MIYRNTPEGFSGDLRAQALVAQGLAAGFDQQLKPIQRVFIYLVLEHCENLAVQNEAVSRFIDLVREQPEAQRAVFEDNLTMPSGIRRSLRGLAAFPIAMRCWGASPRLRKWSS